MPRAQVEALEALTRRPFSHLAPGHSLARLCSALSMPLPPLVAKGITRLPERSQLSRKVSTIFGSTYHQMGKPRKTVS